MKLLIDQNLSPELIALLADLFPQSEHVFNLGMGEAADHVIADYAKRNDFAIVTKDSDFLVHSRGRLQAKVIWICLQNCSTGRVSELLRHYAIRIRQFGDDRDATLLTLM